MLPQADERNADLVGQHRLVDDVTDGLSIADQRAVGAAGDVAEGIETEFESHRHAFLFTCM